MNNSISISPATRIHELPDALKPFLVLLDGPSGLPVCRGCQIALLPKSLMDHFRKHHQLPVGLRSTLASLVATLPPLDYDDVPRSLDGSAPKEALRTMDAFQCKLCPFIRRDPSDVRKHINKEHMISATGNYSEIEAQSWFGGRRTDYWRVCIGPTVTIENGVEQGGAPVLNTPVAISTVDFSIPCGFAFSQKVWAQTSEKWGSSRQQ
jgi:Orsellinic acid/F9775 biosynthesis cluster protein D